MLHVGDEICLVGYQNAIIDCFLGQADESTLPRSLRGRLKNSLNPDSAKHVVKWLPGTVSEQRKYGLESASRFNSVDKNLQLWEEMLRGTQKGDECCVRAMIDMKHKNKCMRDPVIYRCVTDNLHPRFGDKYKAYPTYDFACPVVDAVEGVTHALRTIEYADRNEQYNWFISQLNLRSVNIYEFSKLNFIHTVLSKRKLKMFVEEKHVDGWSDPRFPTIQAVLRRGMTVDALLEFVLTQGASRNANLMEWDKIWAINKQKIDPVIPRYAAVQSDSVELELEGAPASLTPIEVPCHPKNESLGTKKIMTFSRVLLDCADAAEIAEGEEITLMAWGNAIVEKIEKESGKITKLVGKLNLGGDFKTTKKKLHWLPASPADLVPVTLLSYDYLITKPKIEDNDVIEQLINPHSLSVVKGFGAAELACLPKGQRLQLERKGYFIVDVPASVDGTVVLINIPDGKTKNMSKIESNGRDKK